MVYLLHFQRPISPDHTAQHYLGCTLSECMADLSIRIHQHRLGQGARLTEVACERGIGFVVVRIWHGGRAHEAQLKRLKNSPRLCPICNPEMKHGN